MANSLIRLSEKSSADDRGLGKPFYSDFFGHRPVEIAKNLLLKVLLLASRGSCG